MERYTPEERGIIATAYLTNFRSVVLTQRDFRRRFPRRPAPCARTIKRLAERLVQTGSTTDVARSGRPRIARSIENIAAVAEDVRDSPQTSMRQRCTQIGISRRSLNRILVKDLKMFPYKVQTVQQLLPADCQDPEIAPRLGTAGNDAGNQPAKIARITDDHPSRDQIEQLIASNNLNTLTAKQLKAYLQGNDVKDISSSTKAVLIEKVIEYHS